MDVKFRTIESLWMYVCLKNLEAVHFPHCRFEFEKCISLSTSEWSRHTSRTFMRTLRHLLSLKCWNELWGVVDHALSMATTGVEGEEDHWRQLRGAQWERLGVLLLFLEGEDQLVFISNWKEHQCSPGRPHARLSLKIQYLLFLNELCSRWVVTPCPMMVASKRR